MSQQLKKHVHTDYLGVQEPGGPLLKKKGYITLLVSRHFTYLGLKFGSIQYLIHSTIAVTKPTKNIWREVKKKIPSRSLPPDPIHMLV